MEVENEIYHVVALVRFRQMFSHYLKSTPPPFHSNLSSEAIIRAYVLFF